MRRTDAAPLAQKDPVWDVKIVSPTGVLRRTRLVAPEVVAGGARRSVRIAFDLEAPETIAFFERVAPALDASLAAGRARFARYPIEMRRRLKRVAAAPLWTTGDAGVALLRAERLERRGAPLIVGSDGAALRLRDELRPGRPARLTLRLEPTFAPGVAVAGVRFVLEAVTLTDGFATPLEDAA